MKIKTLLVALSLLCVGWSASAAIQAKAVEYKDGDTVLEGWHAYDDAIKGKRPAVLVVHQWKGLSDYEKKRAEMLAKLGYNVFCVDIYGKGIRPSTPKDAGAMAGKYKNDRTLYRQRLMAGLAILKGDKLTDTANIGSIGYCFGGTGVLELARNGADVKGVVSFHGGLATPTPEDAKNIKAKVLACHGADDPHVPPAEVAGFEKEMRDANVDWQLVAYGNAVHSFTDWTAGNDNAKGAAYNEKADKRSWEAMKTFFSEIFSK